MNSSVNKIIDSYITFKKAEDNLKNSIAELNDYLMNNFTTITFDELILIKNDLLSLNYSNNRVLFDETINKVNKYIFKKCNHKWIIDRSSINEHTEFICNTCSLPSYFNHHL